MDTSNVGDGHVGETVCVNNKISELNCLSFHAPLDQVKIGDKPRNAVVEKGNSKDAATGFVEQTCGQMVICATSRTLVHHHPLGMGLLCRILPASLYNPSMGITLTKRGFVCPQSIFMGRSGGKRVEHKSPSRLSLASCMNRPPFPLSNESYKSSSMAERQCSRAKWPSLGAQIPWPMFFVLLSGLYTCGRQGDAGESKRGQRR